MKEASCFKIFNSFKIRIRRSFYSVDDDHKSFVNDFDSVQHEQSTNPYLPLKLGLDQCYALLTTAQDALAANTRSHQLRWDDLEMETAIFCTNTVRLLIQKVGRNSWKALFFVQLSFVRRSYVANVILFLCFFFLALGEHH